MQCPMCHYEIQAVTLRCPRCGHWLCGDCGKCGGCLFKAGQSGKDRAEKPNTKSI